MQRKPLFWFVISVLCLAAAFYFWRLGDRWQAERHPASQSSSVQPSTHSSAKSAAVSPASPQAGRVAPVVITASQTAAAKKAAKNRYPYRLANTTDSPAKLLHNDKALLLMNAMLDTSKPLNLAIPDRLRAAPNSGSYLVQANGPLTDQFRAALSSAGATIVSYIPNNAYLVRVSDAGAQQLASNAQLTQSVLAYEPYYKLDPSLLQLAMEQPGALPPNGVNVTVFADAYQTTLNDLRVLGADVVSQANSPFGPSLKVYLMPGTLSAVAGLPGVQVMSPAHGRVRANDLMRVTLGVATDTLIATTNWLGLSGSNVFININDSGVDATNNADLGASRFFSDVPSALTDANGHGTHVAGTILGNGTNSLTITAQGSVAGASYRGLAYNATAFVMSVDDSGGVLSQTYYDFLAFGGGIGGPSDSYLQETAARTNTFISNNSWNYAGDASYDIAAASYDAAVRDALPEVPGSQPLLYVFSAGNAGSGVDDGTGGSADSILSPATAKNVITVGAVEQPRFIEDITTNIVNGTNQLTTNSIFVSETDSDNQVASFSSRGNVGVNVEGTAGRFKPDVVAPGTFVVSDRSQTWDTNGYYNPTNYSSNSGVDVVEPNNLNPEVTTEALPANVVAIIFTVVTNSFTNLPVSFPTNTLLPLPIYVGVDQTPTTNSYDFLGTNYQIGANMVVLPTNGVAFSEGESITFSVGNATNAAIAFGWTLTLVTTNDTGLFQAMANVNTGLAPWYRYESGTSMAAAGVSGMLALMQEFFQGRLNLTNSPALMKALLINGCRTLGQPYDFSVGAPDGNSQGWGQPSLPNIIPPELVNWTPGNQSTMPLIFIDQNLTNVLATGQSQTRQLVMSPSGTGQDMRITLVWTDPPGSPAAGAKLVNNLVLIVTNMDTGDIFYGNDIPNQSVYNESWDTNGPPNIDLVNNVQNIFLRQPLSTNYSITVLGARVNVNAVTANTNNIVQDYALVISSGTAGAVPGPFNSFVNLNTSGPVTNFSTNVLTNLTVITNSGFLDNQRVGANSQFSGSTNGSVGQWNFYVFTNAASNSPNFTNVAIATSQSPNLGVVRMGASSENGPFSEGQNPDATRSAGADLDLYVSTDPTLTNLNPVAVAAALKSTGRTAAESILISNSSPGKVYYIGIKSEDQEGAQYDLFTVATQLPFSTTDSNGNVNVTMFGLPAPIPGGSPGSPNHARLQGFSQSSALIRKVTVTNTVEHQDFGDLIGTLTYTPQSGGQKDAVLNNHTFFTNVNDTVETFVYDDSGEDVPGTQPSDGPGTLENFVSESASGQWQFVMVNDSSLSDTGQIDNFFITIEPQPPTNGFPRTIGAHSWFYDFVIVPEDATNMTITVTGNPSPVDLYVRAGAFPTFSLYDDFVVISGASDSLSINKFDSPPLNAGIYFYGIYNPNPTPQNVFITVNVQESLLPVEPLTFLSVGNEPLLDDAVTYSTNTVGEDSTVVSAEVGVRIDHPRESDLVLTLISPQGTRTLLSENRGGLDTNGYGSGINITNVLPQVSSGSNTPSSLDIPLTNASGTLVINYNFYSVPDDLRVCYGGSRIFDSGLISGAGTFTVNFGPGSATDIQIVMDEAGTNPNTNGDLWTYSATVITAEVSYAVFSENTNLATIPIKFAPPPFGHAGATLPPQLEDTNGFEADAPGVYSAPTNFDNWSLTNGSVTVVKVPALANDGQNVLALHNGALTRVLPTVTGQSYTLTFAYHGRPNLTTVGWWKGDGTLNDSSANGNNAFVTRGSFNFTNGIVNQSFYFPNNGTGGTIAANDLPIYYLTNAVSVEGWVNIPADLGHPEGIFVRGDNQMYSQPYSMAFNAGEINFEIRSQPQGAVFGDAYALSPITYGVWTHVCGTWNVTNGLVSLYTNGVLANQSNTTVIPAGPLTGGGATVAIGNVGKSSDNYPFYGGVDEITLYNQELSPTQIQDIYAAGSAGKRALVNDSQPSLATLTLGSITNQISASLDQWVTNIITFTANSNNMVLAIASETNASGLADGILLDSFSLVQQPQINPTNYYLPEESLSKLVGEGSKGDWRLEVLDNRVGATNPQPMLVSWELNLVLADKVPAAVPLAGQVPQTNSVGPNSITYFAVNVPPWALFATNILTASGPVNLLFNQTAEPTGTNSGDFTLLPTTTAGTNTLNTLGTSTAPLLPGQRYFLGVQNPNPTTVNFTIEVDFNIIALTNAVPYTNNIAIGNIPQYYQFDVDTNESAVFFQVSNPSGNVELVVKHGAPLPDTAVFDYFSDLPGASPQSIIVLTNSLPVPLTSGRWYLGVFNNDTNTVNYTITATEEGPPFIITLTNGVPFSYQSPPGLALTNFFLFAITNSPPAALFELYGLDGNVDLTLDSNTYPYVAPFYATSSNPGTNREQIVIRTNAMVTNINANWYLGVPNQDLTNVSFTIRAIVSTNGLLISEFPPKETITAPVPGSGFGPTISWNSVQGEMYAIEVSPNLISWTTNAVILGTGITTSYVDTNTPTTPGAIFYRVVQIPTPP